MSNLPVASSRHLSTRSLRWIAALAVAIGALVAIPAAASADPGDLGFEGPAGPGGAPSGSKPESKLWFNDGFWWASMWDTATSDFYIWKLNKTTETWSRTGTVLDDRASTRADVLWDGIAGKLYVASHNFSETDGSGSGRLYRYSYNTSTDTYTVDAGFPKTINSVRSETLVIAKEPGGKLWATWEQGGRIWVNRTTTGDTWGTPFMLPGAAAVNGDDISSIIAFGTDKIGIFWSNQDASPDADYFAVHTNGTTDTTGWAIETAYTGTNLADAHSNLKTDAAGKVYAVVKTSLDNAGSSPLIVLLDRATNGTWANHLVSASSFDQTRPVLEIDETNGLLQVFATSGGSGGTINQHTSPIGSISFDGGAGTVVMKDASALKMNNPTSTKQNITAATGLIVVGYNDTTRHYWHADIFGGGPPPNNPPSANATSATTPAGQAVGVALSGSDVETCDLAFSIVTPPSHGTLGSIGNALCSAGSPNTDTASVTYTPTGGYDGPDSFTYKVNDLTTDSSAATATLSVTPLGGGGGTFTFIATEDAHVKSTSPTTNFGTLTTLQLREEAAPGVTYRDYLKFNVNGMTGNVSTVKLRLWITDVSPDSGTVFGTSTGWSEASIMWNGAPALGSSFGAAGATTTAGTWVEIPLVGSPVTGNIGDVAFALKTTSTNSSIFDSSEGGHPPQLVVTTTAPSDTTAPTKTSAAVNGSSLVIGYDEPLDSSSAPVPAAYDVEVNGSPRSATIVGVSGSAVTLTLASPVVATDNVTVAYTAPGTNPVQDIAGNDALSFTATAVTNNTPPADTTAPTPTTAAVNGTSLVINFDEALDPASTPAGSAFDVQVNASGDTVNNVSLSGSSATLTLATPVTNGQTVTVTYTKPGSVPWLQDVAGNPTATFTAMSVTNNTPPADTTAPSPTTYAVNGSTLVITFDEALDPASTPAGSAFDVQVNASGDTVNTVSLSGASATLTLATAVTNGQTVTVKYTKPGSAPWLQDVATNPTATFGPNTVTNNTPPSDTTAPTKVSQAVNGTSLVIGYDEALDTGSVPAPAAFNVQVGGSSRSISTVGVSGSSVTLTLSSGVLFGQSVTVAYTAPGVGPIQDPAGNDALSFSAVAATNNTPNTAPTANATSATTPFNQAVSVALSGSDAETCDLVFSVVTGPSHGSLGSISIANCTAGSPNTDTASVTYTPTGGYSGPDSFTYKVNDGTTDSTAKTATLTVSAPAGGTFTFVATEDAHVKSTSPTTNYGTLTTLQLREEPSGGTNPTYRDYLKFNVTGMTGTVSTVKLRLWITDVSPDSGTVFGTSTTWSESTITWSGPNAAPALGSSFGSAGATTVVGSWVEITLVGSPVNGNVGNVAFALKTTSSNSSIFDSSEGAHPPELVVITN